MNLSKKYSIKSFEPFDQILFVVDVSKYNLLKESIDLFHGLFKYNDNDYNYKLLERIKILFSKYDIFLKNINNVSINKEFNDFPLYEKNPHNELDVIRFIFRKLMDIKQIKDLNWTNGPIDAYGTSIDANNSINKFNHMFSHIIETTATGICQLL